MTDEITDKVTLKDEIWKTVKEYPDYLVSNTGLVRSLKKDGKILIQQLNRSGYLTVRLYEKGKWRIFTVHKLVALAFIENSLNKPTVNHIDGIKTNNNVENLEWYTYSEQANHAIKTNLRLIKYGEESPRAKFNNEEIGEIKKLYATKKYTYQDLANKYDVNKMTILRIMNDQTYKGAMHG